MAKYKGSWLEFSDLRLRVNDLEQQVEAMLKKRIENIHEPPSIKDLDKVFGRKFFGEPPKSPDWDLNASLAGITIVPSGPDGHLVYITISVKRIPGMGVIDQSAAKPLEENE